MKAIVYLLNATFCILVGVFILRFIMQLVRADFRSPIAQVIMKISNPIVLPLRKVFPPIKKLDTATLVACLLASAFMVLCMRQILGLPNLFNQPLALFLIVVQNLVSILLGLYWMLIFLYVLLSWFSPGSPSPFSDLVNRICEPLMSPIRRIMPDLGGLDLTPIPVLLIIGALQTQFGFLYW